VCVLQRKEYDLAIDVLAKELRDKRLLEAYRVELSVQYCPRSAQPYSTAQLTPVHFSPCEACGLQYWGDTTMLLTLFTTRGLDATECSRRADDAWAAKH
jgi:hypothetical protein